MDLLIWIGSFMICSSVFWTCYAFWINRKSNKEVDDEFVLHSKVIPVEFSEETKGSVKAHNATAHSRGKVTLKGKATELSNLSKSIFISAN